MDLLFSRYASPLDLLNTYLDSGRFGEFVSNFLELENERMKEKAEHDDNWKLWMMYTRILPEKSFMDWKANLDNTAPTERTVIDTDLTAEGIQDIMDNLFSE